MQVFTFINLFCIPFSAYWFALSENTTGRVLNAFACLFNLAIIAAKLA